MPSSHQAGEFAPPERVEEYRLLRLIGRGAMGQVYLAHDTLLDRQVAIKFITAASDRTLRERFFIEARAIARLSHPNVVGIYRVGEVAGSPYLVSEYVAGASLAEIGGPVPEDRVLAIALGITRGLRAAHACGVLHRDIKPANIILTHAGEPKLLDFGLAKLQDGLDPSSPDAAVEVTVTVPQLQPAAGLDDTLSHAGDAGPVLSAEVSLSLALTRPGTILGTPRYMAPEAWRGEPATAGTDLYSLGVVLYELCAGRPPHQQALLPILREAVMTLDAPPLEVPGISPGLAAVVGRCLRRDPAQRFASAEELLGALESLRRPAPAKGARLALSLAGGVAALVVSGGLLARGLLEHGPGHPVPSQGTALDVRPGPPVPAPGLAPHADAGPSPSPPRGASSPAAHLRQRPPRTPRHDPPRNAGPHQPAAPGRDQPAATGQPRPSVPVPSAPPAPPPRREELKNEDIPIER